MSCMVAPYSLAAGAASDANFSDVVLLLNGYTTNGGTTFTDKSPVARTITNSGVATSTAQHLFSAASIQADTAGDNLTMASNSDLLFNGTFTLEFQIYVPTGFPGGGAFFMGNNATGGRYLNLSSTGVLTVTATSTLTIGTLTLNTWHQITVTQNGSNNFAYLNGTRTSTSTSLFTESGPAPRGIFHAANVPAGFSLLAYMDEIRWTKNVCRYTGSSITPQSAPWPDH